jgi:hypothetical protein
MAKKKKEKEDWVARLKRKVKEYFSKEKHKMKGADTVRTKATEKQLKKSGLTDADIARFHKKKAKKK